MRPCNFHTVVIGGFVVHTRPNGSFSYCNTIICWFWLLCRRYATQIHKSKTKKTQGKPKKTRKPLGTTFLPRLWFFGFFVHYLGSHTMYLRGNTDSKHRKQVIQGKGKSKKPYSQKPYAHMHVEQEGSRRLLYLNVQGEIHLQRQVTIPSLFTRSIKKKVFFTTKLLCQKGTTTLRKLH